MRRMLTVTTAMAMMVAMVTLTVGPASAAMFSNNDGITINDAWYDYDGYHRSFPSAATPYPSEIEVSGLSTSVQDVNLTLKNYYHTFPGDVDVLLVGPQGQKALVMSDVGCLYDVAGIDLTLDDEATGSLPSDAAILPGAYKPSQGATSLCVFGGEQVPAHFPSPAPAGPYGTQLSVLDGTDPNGTWRLYVIDDTEVDAGSIGGWSLDISATTPADTTPPTVSAWSPQRTASKTANVTATFSEPVQNVTPETFVLERNISVKKAPPRYERVDATVSPSADGLSAVLDPAQDLPKGDYRATIATEVTDLANPANVLDQDSAQTGNQPKVWTFTVAK
jgi:subtilisin-like proprotein convertase family protein